MGSLARPTSALPVRLAIVVSTKLTEIRVLSYLATKPVAASRQKADLGIALIDIAPSTHSEGALQLPFAHL